jgi:bifunctional DNA-binding transcriptional regulator/antitoxin component of YhaV-PrlF toxin-antitoxin module
MFKGACEHIKTIFEQGLMANGVVYRCETLEKPRHNALKYSRTPLNHLVLFDIQERGGRFLLPEAIRAHANIMQIDMIPVLVNSSTSNIEQATSFLEQESCRGGAKIEGVVIKNYDQGIMAKLVRSEFKEVNAGKPSGTKPNTVEALIERFKCEARWRKALIHLHERGELKHEMSDIPRLMKEIHEDVMNEEKELIKDLLLKCFEAKIAKDIVSGLPAWYENLLIKQNMEASDEN